MGKNWARSCQGDIVKKNKMIKMMMKNKNDGKITEILFSVDGLPGVKKIVETTT